MNACPLTPRQLRLLQTAVLLRSAESKPLAGALRVSPNTVRTYFYRICETLDADTRFAAIIIALQSGWIALADLAAVTEVRLSQRPVCK